MHLVADGGGSSAAVPIPRLRPARAEHLRELLQSGDDGRWKSHLLVLVGRETACPLRGDGSACLTLGDQRVECLTCQHGAGVADCAVFKVFDRNNRTKLTTSSNFLMIFE